MIPLTKLVESPLSPDKKKDTPEFGLKIIRSCYNRWKNGYGGETFTSRIARIYRNRLYYMGKQNTDQYKDILKVDGQIQIINLDHTPLAIAKPLLDAKIDRYMQRDETIHCRSFGPIAESKKKKEKDKARFKMNYRPAIQELQKSSGLQLEQFSDDDPASEMELDIHFKTKYKPKESIIMQMSSNLVFEKNEWDDIIKPKLLMDVFCAGYSVVKTELDSNGWIKTPWVDPVSFITSYSEYDDFRDWQWQGQRISLSIIEIRSRWPGKFTEEELWSLANRFKGKYGNSSDYCEWSDNYYTSLARPYDAVNCEVVDLYYKTLYNLTYEKKENSFGREIYKEVDTIKSNKKYEKSAPYYVAYHGVWIIDTDHVLEWGLAKNMLKPNSNLVEIRSPYACHMYANNRCSNTALIETMIPLIDLMQNIHMQTQKIIATTAPDGYDINILGLTNMDMGQGVGVVSPMQAFGLYLQSGNQYYMDREPDSDKELKPPIQPRNNQYSNKLEQLDAQWWSAYKKLQIITGDNNLSQGNITNQGVANSTLNEAKNIADNASNYAYKSYLTNYKNTAKNVELLLLDKFFLKNDMSDVYIKTLGEEDIKYLKEMGNEDVDMIMFDTDIKLVNKDADKARWDKFIEISLQQGQISPDDVATLDLIQDQTYRSFLFAQAVKEKKASDMEISKQNSENNVAQAKAAADAKGQHDMNLELKTHENKIALQKEEFDSKTIMKNMESTAQLEGKIIDSILSNPESRIDQIPNFIWEKLHISDENTKKLVLQSMQKSSQQQQQLQQGQLQQQQPQQ